MSERLSEAVKDSLSAHRVLDLLLEEEMERREERRIQTSLRLSGLPQGQTLGNFDFLLPALDRQEPHPDAGHL